jgi:hypothetical protein
LDHLRHDTGYSSVLWISEWPSIDATPSFLHALIFAPGIRRSLCVVARPLGPAQALREIRKEKVDYITDREQDPGGLLGTRRAMCSIWGVMLAMILPRSLPSPRPGCRMGVSCR